jgi:hypothetical protein
MAKIRITQAPESGNSTKTLKPVDRIKANIEAEKGETALADFDNDGELEHMNIGGNRHSQGGTPLRVPDSTFIYSDTKDMRLKGDLLKFFGKNPDNKKGYTPAEIAKQYDLSKFKVKPGNPDEDPFTKRTNELMTENLNSKLGQLAFIQEAHKGFPNGIPEVAIDFASSLSAGGGAPEGNGQPVKGYDPQSVSSEYQQGGSFKPTPAVPRQENTGNRLSGDASVYQDSYNTTFSTNQHFTNAKELAYYQAQAQRNLTAGFISDKPNKWQLDHDQAIVDAYQDLLDNFHSNQKRRGTTDNQTKQYAEGGNFTDPYKGGSKRTPTNHTNAFDRSNDYLKGWEGRIPGISKMDNTSAQGAMYDYMLKNDPSKVKDMWSKYGITNAGKNIKGLDALTTDGRFSEATLNDPNNLTKLRGAYTDGMFGVRQFEPETTARNSPLEAFRTPLTPTANLSNGVLGNNFVKPNDYTKTTDNTHYDNLTPDEWSMAESLRKREGIKKYLPYIATPDMASSNPTFYDPTRELVAGQESENAQLMYAAQMGSAQQQRANGSSIAGQAAYNAANTIGKYDNMNVGIANQFSAHEAETMNNYSALRAKNETDLYNGNVIANQQYDNAVTAADDDLLRTHTNAWNNRSQLELMNKTNNHYTIDPITGNMVFNPGGADAMFNNKPVSPSTYLDQYKALQAQYRSANPRLSDEELHRWVMQGLDGGKETTTYKGTNPIAASTRLTRDVNR